MHNKGILKAATLVCIGLALAGLGLTGCKSEQVTSKYARYDLVSDTAGYVGARLDARLLNAWGIAIDASGNFLIGSNHNGDALWYDGDGLDVGTPITVPAVDTTTMGAPSGIARNTTADFKLPGTSEPAKMIFVTEDGLVAAWSTGLNAIKVADRSGAGAVYKGVAIAADGSDNFIYAANFKGHAVDVFDKDFNYITSKPFTDPDIPSNYGPFNIVNIGGKLYVSYAVPKSPDFVDDSSGAGVGYMDVFEPSGLLNKRFVSQGYLNSPWGMALARAEFGQYNNAILVGNFGDGYINAYATDGSWLGPLKDELGNAVQIDGLWGLAFKPALDPDKLYYTAGPNEENHGLFGYLKME
jgi:uncharacterized protein (TIGR03118 family)